MPDARAGDRRAGHGGLRDTVHLALTHDSGAASTVTVSHTVSPLSTGMEFFVHGDAGRLALLPETGRLTRRSGWRSTT